MKDETRKKTSRHPWCPLSEVDNWELRCIAISREACRGSPRHQWRGEVHMRHGNQNGLSWWLTPSDASLPKKKEEDFIIEDLHRESKSWFRNWNLCVCVRKAPFINETIRSELLKACSGQSSNFCSKHRCALTTAPSKVNDFRCCAVLKTISTEEACVVTK